MPQEPAQRVAEATPTTPITPPELPPHAAPLDHPLVLHYRSVRRAIGLLGLAMPVVLVVGGYLLFGLPLQDNLSSYYHTPMRDVFVGLLCALGLFLFCYRGHDKLEDWTANAACFFALGLALFPIDDYPQYHELSAAQRLAPASSGSFEPFAPRSLPGLLHTICGGGFFLTLALYCLFYFPKTRFPPDPDAEPHAVYRSALYRLQGLSLLLSMSLMGVYLVLLPDDWQRRADGYRALLWLEWVAVWSFAGAWLMKGRLIVTDTAVDLLVAVEQRLRPRAESAER
jgi:hypothetical protein